MNRRTIAACILVAATQVLAQSPQLINFQGRLINGTNLYNGDVNLRFRLYTLASGGTYLFESTNRAVVVDGLYSTLIGEYATSGTLANALSNPTLYLEVAVNGAAFSPRERIGSSAYALNAWNLSGNPGTSNGMHFLGTTDNRPLEFKVNSQRVLRLEPNATSPNILGGYSGNTISTGVYGAVLAGGGRGFSENKVTDNYGAIGGGRGNTAGNDGGSGGDATEAVVAGGLENKAGGSYSTVPGGRQNEALGSYSFAAGRRAKATNTGSFVWADSTDANFSSTADNQFMIRAANGVGINTNPSPGDSLAVLGGIRVGGAAYAESFVGDGSGLTALDGQALVNGSVSNAALGAGAITGDKIAAGTVTASNLAPLSVWKASGNAGTTGGVHFVGTTDNQPLDIKVNNARALRIVPDANSPSLIGGQSANYISNGVEGAAIAGGGSIVYPNRITDHYGAVGGGRANQAGDNDSSLNDASYATVAGGYNNIASGAYAVVSGGADNRAGGIYATIPGGDYNWAQGRYSLAAGRRARALHEGSFVWADSTDADFSSSASNQFLVRAGGGVGIGESSPRTALSVGNNLDLYSGVAASPGQASIRGSPLGHLILNARSNSNVYVNYDSGQDTILNLNGGAVGIGTNDPTETLTVAGPIRATEVVYAESFVGNGSGLTSLDGANLITGSVTAAKLGTMPFWSIDGNAGTTSSVHFVGTTDNTPLILRVNNRRVLRTDWGTPAVSPNWVAGYSNNEVYAGVDGGTIAGGGGPGQVNYVSDHYGTIGGGLDNVAGSPDVDWDNAPLATVAGGLKNEAQMMSSFIGGGESNLIQGTDFHERGAGIVCGVGNIVSNASKAVILGGARNFIGDGCYHSVIGGGSYNYMDYMSWESMIGSGVSNKIMDSSEWAFIGGGRNNSIRSLGWYAVIGGGQRNTINWYGNASVIAGGEDNVMTNHIWYAVIGGGKQNKLSGDYTTIGGGGNNVLSGDHATVAGGRYNQALATNAFVGGGMSNSAIEKCATAVGGYGNQAEGEYATIGGGYGNRATGHGTTIAGGGGMNPIFGVYYKNSASSMFSTVGGGGDNEADNNFATVAGGFRNHASQDSSFVGGGQMNQNSGPYATIVGGYSNINYISWYAVIAGGRLNAVSNANYSVVGGGASNLTQGAFSTIPGGQACRASGDLSFAAGRRAKALHDGAFVWADSTAADFASTTNDEFAIRATNGLRMAVDCGPDRAPRAGAYYGDNAILAWANVDSNGVIQTSFGVESATNVMTGAYEIILQTGASAVSSLIPTALAEVDGAPVNAAGVRLVSINLMSATKFRVYINDGNYNLVNNQFIFTVTGR